MKEREPSRSEEQRKKRRRDIERAPDPSVVPPPADELSGT
jgi:hypothetical protein